jgi:hypothetical protein
MNIGGRPRGCIGPRYQGPYPKNCIIMADAYLRFPGQLNPPPQVAESPDTCLLSYRWQQETLTDSHPVAAPRSLAWILDIHGGFYCEKSG